MIFRIHIALLLFTSAAFGASEVQFHADFYQRDLVADTVLERGNAWVKQGEREIWADEILVFFKTKLVEAKGNVHIRDGGVDIWAKEATYSLNEEKGTMIDVILAQGQMVITGAVVRKLSRDTFEVEEGSYSNCNTTLMKDSQLGTCKLDWKLFGRRFSITTESFAQFTDALVYVRDMPILYTPYFIVPVKTKRQTGFLLPGFNASSNLGSGTSLPFYLNLGAWQDLTVTPTLYSKTGLHTTLDYRYVYSGDASGRVQIFFTDRRFSDDVNNPANNDPAKNRLFGLVGEWAISAQNRFPVGERGHSRQQIQLVSNPYFTQDYSADLNVSTHASYLRSQVSLTLPYDHWLATAQIRHQQSMVISKDTAVDQGAPTELPSLSLYRTTSPLGRFFAWEADFQATNFFRVNQFDQVPGSPATSGSNFDPDRAFDSNDYIRSGRRIQIEPRLIANVPMPQGFQLQPVLTAGTYLYHFDLPSSSTLHREYLQAEIPFSVYLSRQLETGISGFEKISHVFQPRVTYARSLYDNGSSATHPFLFESGPLSNPRFDIRDQFSDFEYLRFELINRFRRQSGGSRSRFLLLSLAQQYNLKKIPGDPRYDKRLGPIEIFSEMNVWKLALQLQATYDLEATRFAGKDRNENNWSGSLVYQDGDLDFVRVNTLIRNKADPTLTEQSLYVDFYKQLPLFFDLGGKAEYSMKGAGLLGYSLQFIFGVKERACWGLSLLTGRDSLKRPFVSLDFRLSFGNPKGVL